MKCKHTGRQILSPLDLPGLKNSGLVEPRVRCCDPQHLMYNLPPFRRFKATGIFDALLRVDRDMSFSFIVDGKEIKLEPLPDAGRPDNDKDIEAILVSEILSAQMVRRLLNISTELLKKSQ